MNNFLSGLLVRLFPIKQERWAKLKRPLQAVAFAIGVLLLSVVLVRLLYFLEGYFERPLEEIALQAYLVVFGANLVGSATIIFPTPVGDATMMAVAAKLGPVGAALAASVGSTLGEITAYYVGLWGRAAIARGHSGAYMRAEGWMRRYGWVALAVFAFMPFFIFDLVGIVAGAVRFPIWKFLLATCAGRLPRCFLGAYFGFQVFPHIFPSLFG